MRRSFLLSALLGLAALALASTAAAETVVRTDAEGRTITFDVRDPDADVDWYADLLTRTAHGDEISSVTFHLVTPRSVGRNCGPEAGGCYFERGDGPHILVPADRSAVAAHTLLHEYGHHVDASYPNGRLAEPNGTPGWWRARGLGRLDRAGEVARDYSLGWDRSIGEIFAEDYAQLNLETFYKIGWLDRPGAAVLDALRADLGARAAAPIRPSSDPLVVRRRGTIAPGERRTLPFGLLGPGRHVTFVAKLAGSETAGSRARIELVCGARRVARAISSGEASERIDRRNLGPGECEVALVSAADGPLAYDVQLRLAVEVAA
jgi:hypothetical protein